MDKKELIKPFDKGVAARTNILKILGNQEQLIDKLIAKHEEIGAITYLCREIERGKKEEKENYYRCVDSEIKDAIRNELRLGKSEPIEYDRFSKKNRHMFFFIGESSCNSEKLLADAKNYDIGLEKILQTLFSLRVKLAYINDVATDYEIKPALYNADLYLGAMKTKKLIGEQSLVEALRLNLYFSKQNEIALSLQKRAFSCIYEDNFIPDGLFFHHKSKNLKVKESLDAVRHAERPYMMYSLSEKYRDDSKYANKGYENSINYHLTDALNKLITVLSNTEIAFNPIQFKANYIVSDFIESNKDYKNELIIIDTFIDYKSDEWRTMFREYLQQTFNAKHVIGLEEAPTPEQLKTEGISYLVVNQEQKKNGSSIIKKDTGEALNSFFQALELHLKKEGKVEFDYYTSVKVHQFQNKLFHITQGLNIDKIIKKTTPKDNEGNKLVAVTALKNLDENKIQKIKTELWLKECVFHHKKIEGLNFPYLELVLFFVRKLKNKQTYISVVDVTTHNKGITINEPNRYESNEEGCFKFKHEYLKNALRSGTESFFEKMYNGSFYIYDKINQKILLSYSSDAVPNIIGNAAFDNVERSKLTNDINRKNPPKNCVLPYYINPKRRQQHYHVFLEDCKQDGLRYFVMPKSNSPDSTIAKQYRMQNILIFDNDGNKNSPLEEKLTTLFLQSFTFDILNNKEVSKKSILQKIAELYIEN